MFELFRLDPLLDPRWAGLVERRNEGSVFHTCGWLDAIRRTYGYKPVVFTTSSAAAKLEGGLLFCEISTWLSGRRIVSVPFSDHADFLIDPAAMQYVLSSLRSDVDRKVCDYLELRPGSEADPKLAGFTKTDSFYIHKLDLKNSLEKLYKSFHKDCVQRVIRRTVKNGLKYSEGRSETLIEQFYSLLLLTHKRHGLPPQPISWFRNLSHCLRDNFKIRMATSDGIPVASIITLTHKKSMVYKYGCSDAKYHSLGGMTLLLWQAIQDAKYAEIEQLDMGRSDCHNRGLINFKEHWGAARSTLAYWGYPAKLRPDPNNWLLRAARAAISILPTVVLPPAGRLLYRHLG